MPVHLTFLSTIRCRIQGGWSAVIWATTPVEAGDALILPCYGKGFTLEGRRSLLYPRSVCTAPLFVLQFGRGLYFISSCVEGTETMEVP